MEAHAHELLCHQWSQFLLNSTPSLVGSTDLFNQSAGSSGAVGNILFSSVLHVGSRNNCVSLTDPFFSVYITATYVGGVHSKRLHPPRILSRGWKISLLNWVLKAQQREGMLLATTLYSRNETSDNWVEGYVEAMAAAISNTSLFFFLVAS